MVKPQSSVKLSSCLDLKSTFFLWNKGTFKSDGTWQVHGLRYLSYVKWDVANPIWQGLSVIWKWFWKSGVLIYVTYRGLALSFYCIMLDIIYILTFIVKESFVVKEDRPDQECGIPDKKLHKQHICSQINPAVNWSVRIYGVRISDAPLFLILCLGLLIFGKHIYSSDPPPPPWEKLKNVMDIRKYIIHIMDLCSRSIFNIASYLGHYFM